MAFQSFWYQTKLPQEIVDIVIKDLKTINADDSFKESTLTGGRIDPKRRKSKNAWIPTDYWLAGYLWYYINKINQENFKYDLWGIDNDTIQYTQYEEGEFYTWHVDSGFSDFYSFEQTRTSVISDEEKQQEYFTNYLSEKTEFVRKLSFTLQLSDPDDYEGGDVQLMDDYDGLYTLPKERGTIIAFDSRTRHRVRKVKKGVRRSIVGWCVGPRWK
jgi:PKHD-type hydroxylase